MVERRQISSRNCFIDRKSHGCMQKILQKYRTTGCVANIPGRGRKVILSVAAKRKIIRSVKKNPLLSAPKLASSVLSEIGKKISAESVRGVLHNAGFHGRTPVRKSDGQYKVWRQVGKELDPKNTIKTVKYGGGSVLPKSAVNVGLGSNFIRQQDNDPKHTAKIVKLYLVYHCKKELPTPPQSLDLNVIENLWSQLEKFVDEHAITRT
ncbi:transposable element Tcb1 transposase [Trichonephila clavipes]|nr:transposable element Tcb1 transposase [Trichonephila clavipes]